MPHFQCRPPAALLSRTEFKITFRPITCSDGRVVVQLHKLDTCFYGCCSSASATMRPCHGSMNRTMSHCWSLESE